MERLNVQSSLGIKLSLKTLRLGDMRGTSSGRRKPVPKDTTRLGLSMSRYRAETS